MSTEPNIARDAGPFNVREAKASLDYHVARAAKRGDYGCVCDLQAVAELIDQLVENHDLLASQLANFASAAFDSMHTLDGMAKALKSGIETFKDTP